MRLGRAAFGRGEDQSSAYATGESRLRQIQFNHSIAYATGENLSSTGKGKACLFSMHGASNPGPGLKQKFGDVRLKYWGPSHMMLYDPHREQDQVSLDEIFRAS
jgi:hypothetical protein